MRWDRKNDTFGPFPINLDIKANTKRKILSSLNYIYDLFNLYAPLLNRAKLFMQRLQTINGLSWDNIISSELLQEWITICKQANATPEIALKRFVGEKNGNYSLVAFCDSSAAIYGTVVYLVDNLSKRVSFLIAKNKILGTKLQSKSIPSLECQAIALATRVLTDIYEDLCGEKVVMPIAITGMYVYSDSMVSFYY